jgi:hypothetical protein
MVGIFSVCDALWQLSVVFVFPIFLRHGSKHITAIKVIVNSNALLVYIRSVCNVDCGHIIKHVVTQQGANNQDLSF